MTPSRVGFLVTLALHGALLGLLLWFWQKPSVPTPPEAGVPITLSMFAPAPTPTPPSEATPEPSPEPSPKPLPEPAPEPLPVVQPVTQPAESPKIAQPKPEKIRPAAPKHTEPKTHPKPTRSAAQPSEAPPASAASTPPAPEPSIKAPAAPAAPAPAPEPVPIHEAKQDLLSAYQAALAAAIEREKFYPPLARRLNLEGVVEVGFTVQADGRIVNIHLLTPAPSAVLERGAIEAIARVGQFTPIPAKLGINSMNLTISLVYKLR